MDFCNFCLNLFRIITNSERWASDLEKTGNFEETAKHCKLCQMIVNSAEFSWVERSHFIRFRKAISCRDADRELICGCSLEFKDDCLRDVRLAVWAIEGSPASGCVTTQPPLFSDRPEAICRMSRSWLHECFSLHDCASREDRRLPTRVLEVQGQFEESLTARLVVTDGAIGKFCALSHCWGDKQLLTTTRTNIQDHLRDIPFHTLPKTFRDTLILAWGLGINYVWIDSLCIVQDDEHDWRHESELMDSVFQEAVVVITAAGSKNSTEGLFIAHRPEHPVLLELPYFTAEGNIEGTFIVSRLSDTESDPIRGPLRRRAWAYQEWSLAQRQIFFMPGGISWRCKALSVSERGQLCDLQLRPNAPWFSDLQAYSEKELTYPSDRLAAIQGVVREKQKSRKNKFILGVWENEIEEHLIWRSYSDFKVDVTGLPSWCWAASKGKKLWLPTDHANGVQKMSPNTTIGVSGSLKATGLLVQVDISKDSVSNCCVSTFMSENGDWSPLERAMLPGDTPDNHPSYLVLDDSNSTESMVLGLAVFDQDYISNVMCFIVSSSLRAPFDGLYSGFDVNSDESEGESSEDTEGSALSCNEKITLTFDVIRPEDKKVPNDEIGLEHEASNGIHKNPAGCLNFHEFARSKYVYWALLLEPLREAKTRYKRVGMAMLYPTVYDLNNKDLVELEIV